MKTINLTKEEKTTLKEIGKKLENVAKCLDDSNNDFESYNRIEFIENTFCAINDYFEKK